MNALRATLICLLAVASPAAAGGPGALVVDISGEVTPEVDLFEEVTVGTELTLGPGAALTLEHYASCEVVTVTGGSVTVLEDGLGLDEADVALRAQAPCPEPIALAATDTVSASVVMRGADVLPKVALAPTIVVAGEAAAGIEAVRIERDGRLVARLNVDAGRVDWPEGSLFLTDGAKYLLILEGADAEHRAEVVADRAANGRVVLRP